jgi:hypothetical protein
MRILLLFICCFSVQLAVAQKFSYKKTSDEGRFSLYFPMDPTVDRKEIQNFKTVLYTGLLESDVYLFSYSPIPVSDDEINETIQATIIGFMESVNMITINEKAIKKGKAKGMYCEGKAENGLSVAYEVYYYKKILYQIGVMSRGNVNTKSMKAFSKKLKINP